MKHSFETSKLYYGFPIFILGYQDQAHGYNVTTCSSSYSLGDWLVIGVGSEENAADQIKHYQKFTVNIPHKCQSRLLMVKLNQESCEWLPLKTGWYRGYTFVPVIVMAGIFYIF